MHVLSTQTHVVANIAMVGGAWGLLWKAQMLPERWSGRVDQLIGDSDAEADTAVVSTWKRKTDVPSRLWIEIDAALVNNEVAVLVHEPSINQGGIDLQGPGQHHGHSCYMTVVSGAPICSVLDGKADNGGVIGNPCLSLSTMKNENDRLVRDTNSKIDALELTTTTIEITVEMDRPRTVKKRLAAKAGCVREG